MAWDNIPDWAFAVAQSLLQALKERDDYTSGHCRRVARHARRLAEAMGLNEYEQRVVEFSSLFHDLGKMGIPDHVLLKPGRLTPREEQIMMNHPLKSVEILTPLSQIPFFREVVPGVRNHHERMDGAGYPDGLKGDEIPIAARIILVVDTFDAMTTTRPYRKGMDAEAAFKELKLFSGRQFDPSIVKTFLDAQPHWKDSDADVFEEKRVTPIRKKKAA